MPNTRTIAEALRYSDADVALVEHRALRSRLKILAAMWLYPIVIMLLVAWRAGTGWSDGQWDTHIWAADISIFVLFMHLPMLPMFLVPYLGIDFLLAQSRMRPGLTQLRDAAIEGDEQLAPRATPQPAPFPAPLLTTHIVPISLPTQLGDKNYIRLIGPSFAALPISIITTSILTLIWPTTDEIRVSALIFGGVSLVLLVPVWLVLRRRARKGGKTSILVDADGVSWTELPTSSGKRTTLLSPLDPKTIRVPWLELRTFFTFAGVESGIEHRLYALATANEIFTWEVRGDSPDDAREMSDLLCRLVATYTRLPLRDISPAVAILDDVTPREAMRWSERMREARGTHAPIPLVPTPSGAWVRFRPAILGLIVLTALPSLLYISIYSAQRYQSNVYATLLAEVHSHVPLYHDALDVPDSDWPVHPPTADDSRGYMFTHGTYQLSGTTKQGYIIAVTSSPSGVVDGDVAMEVTARQYGGPDYLGVGLTLYVGDSNEEAVVFTVSPSGEWVLQTHEQKRSLFSLQGEQYVHGQAGAPNRLTLIVRGGEYICYINGHFVGVERDAVTHYGHVGVAILTTGAMTGAFTDFTVYPV